MRFGNMVRSLPAIGLGWILVVFLETPLDAMQVLAGNASSPSAPGYPLQPSPPVITGAHTLQGQNVVTVSNDANDACACAEGRNPSMRAFPGPPQVALHPNACQPCIQGVDCRDQGPREERWSDSHLIDFQPLQHGEFVGPIRIPAMLEYRIRIGDELQFVYVNSRQQISPNYRLQVGDELRISSVTDSNLNMGDNQSGVAIQPDGNIHVRMVGPVRAAGLTIPQLRQSLESAYKKYLKTPAIDVEPFPGRTNTLLRDLQASVSSQFAVGGLVQVVTVNPDGRVNLPLIGSLYVYGLTTDEIRREVNLRYVERNALGLEVEPRLSRRAANFVFVSGEVNKPGKYEMTGPTSVTQALAMAENIKNGGNHRQIVIFRRADDWRMVATKLDLRGAHLGRRPTPSDEIWLRDSDIVFVPPTPMKVMDNLIEQVFTNGAYRVFPFNGFSIQKQ